MKEMSSMFGQKSGVSTTMVRVWGVGSFVAGLVFDMLFFQQSLGLNLPIFTLLTTSVFAGLLYVIDPRNLSKRFFLFVAVMFFAAAGILFRASDALTFFNCILWLIGLIGISHPQESFAITLNRLFAPVRTIILPTAFAFSQIASLSKKHEDIIKRRQMIRGIILSLPFLLFFIALFSSADAIFNETLERVLRSIEQSDFILHSIILTIITCFGVSILSFAFGSQILELQSVRSFLFTARRVTQFPSTEMMVVVLMFNAVFGLFLLSHIGYLFVAGDALSSVASSTMYIQEQQTTYAEYARNGFFQLLVAAGVATVLILAFEKYRRFQSLAAQKEQGRGLEYVSIALLIQVFFVDLSAAGRLWMYINAYGLTELRFYSAIGIPVIALIVLVLIWILWNERRLLQLFQGVTMIFIATIIILNIVNPDALIARYNIMEFGNSKAFDASYLRNKLSLDAAPELLNAEENVKKQIDAAKSYDFFHSTTPQLSYKEQVAKTIQRRKTPKEGSVTGLFGFSGRWPSWHYAAWRAEKYLLLQE